MNKKAAVFLAGVLTGAPFFVFADIAPGFQPPDTVSARAEVIDTTLGDAPLVLPHGGQCVVSGIDDNTGKTVERSYEDDMAICVLHALAARENFSVGFRFYGAKAFIESLSKDGVTYDDSTWFAINGSYNMGERCDRLLGMSISTCRMEPDDDLAVFQARRQPFTFLMMQDVSGRYDTDEPVAFAVSDQSTHVPVADADIVCNGETLGTTDTDGRLSQTLSEGSWECRAEKDGALRSRRYRVIVDASADDDPPSDDNPPADNPPPDKPPQDGSVPPDDTDEPPDNTDTPPDATDNPHQPHQPHNPQPDAGENPDTAVPPDSTNDTQDAPLSIHTVSDRDRMAAAQRAAAFLTTVQDDTGRIADDGISAWAAMGFAATGRPPFDVHQGGVSLDEVLWRMYVGGVSALTLARHILALTASGHNLHAVHGANLCADLRTHWNGKTFGNAALLNDDIFGLLAARACTDASLQTLLRRSVQEGQNADGGFGIRFSDASNVDMTAAAVQALASAGVRNEPARAYLAQAQNRDGGFPYMPGDPSNTGSTSWAINAIIAMGDDPNTWHAASDTPWSYLRSHQLPSGAMVWMNGDTPDILMTAYALTAFAGAALPVVGHWDVVPMYQPQTAVADGAHADMRNNDTEISAGSSDNTVPRGVITSVAVTDRDEDMPPHVLGAQTHRKIGGVHALDLALFVTLAVVLESAAFWGRRYYVSRFRS